MTQCRSILDYTVDVHIQIDRLLPVHSILYSFGHVVMWCTCVEAVATGLPTPPSLRPTNGGQDHETGNEFMRRLDQRYRTNAECQALRVNRPVEQDATGATSVLERSSRARSARTRRQLRRDRSCHQTATRDEEDWRRSDRMRR